MKRRAIIALGIVNLVVLPSMIAGACIRTAPSLPVAAPEAESLFTSLTGAWVLNREATNSSRTSLQSAVVNSDGLMVVPANEASQIMREIPGIEDQATLHFVSDAVLKLTRQPLTLALHVDPTQVVSVPTPGNGVTLLMDGTPVTDTVRDHRIRNRVSWQGEKLGLERRVGSEIEVREVFEVVDGQLRIARTLRAFGVTSEPFLWVYDRKEGGLLSSEDRREQGPWTNGNGNSTPKQIHRERARETLVREYLASGLASQGVTGRVLVKIQLDIKARVQNVEVAESSGNMMLDQLALRVARTYRFTPIVYQGEAVPGYLRMPLNFSVRRQ